MATTLKVLGQLVPASGTLSTLYTVPGATSVTVSSVTICNQGAATVVRLSFAVVGAADDPKQYVYYDLPVAANDTFVATIGATLAAAGVVRCQSANGLVSFNAFGIEVT